MHRSLVVTGLAVFLALGLAACNEDSVPAAPGSGGRPPNGTGGTGGSAATGGDAGTGGNLGTGGDSGTGGAAGRGGAAGAGGDAGAGGSGGAEVLGDCNNEDDVAALAQLDPNARQLASEAALTCSDDILDKPAFTTCVEMAFPSLSDECAACYGVLAYCSGTGGTTCNQPCANDSCSQEPPPDGCYLCPGYDTCLGDLMECTGTIPRDCPET